MKEAYAITGYVSDDVVVRLKPNSPGSVEVRPERGVSEVVMQVEGSNVTEIRTGASSGGETLVQLILRDEAAVNTVIRSTAASKGLKMFHDPAIARLTSSATAKVIML